MVITLQPINPHAHFRGTEYPIDYLGIGIRHAMRMQFAAVLEQPNPKPNLIDEASIENRLLQAHKYTQGRIYHGCHVGLTKNIDQVRNAFKMAAEHRYNVRAVKAFWVDSTGEMGLLDPDYRKAIWREAVNVGFKGPFIQHCEEENRFTGEFDPAQPITHSRRQNEDAETMQVEQQIRNAQDIGFRGRFYIAHVSSPNTIDYLESLGDLPFEVVREVTWHHLFCHTGHYETYGNRLKMNPPLRDRRSQERHLEYALQGKFTLLGSDHAPHPLELKDGPKPPSGIPTDPFYPRGIETLFRLGMSMEQRDNMLFHAANRVFDLNLKPKRVSIKYDPSMWDPYGYNPFEQHRTI